jgi:hypothetical protein
MWEIGLFRERKGEGHTVLRGLPKSSSGQRDTRRGLPDVIIPGDDQFLWQVIPHKKSQAFTNVIQATLSHFLFDPGKWIIGKAVKLRQASASD